MRKVNPIYATIGIVIILFIAVAVASILDWIVTNWVNNPYIESAARTAFNQQYQFWFSAAMLTFGIIGTAIILLVARTKSDYRLAIVPLFTGAIFVVGNLEDCLYFLLGQGYFPSANTFWNWMPQASNSYLVSFFRIFGCNSWSTVSQQVWSSIWLFIVLPVGLVIILKAPKIHGY